MENLLEIKNLNVKRNGFSLKDINLSIPKGVVVGLIGRNGVGKSTLLNACMDLYSRESGEIFWKNIPIEQNSTRMKSQVGFVPDHTLYVLSEKAGKIAKQIAPFYPDWSMERWHTWMERFQLSEQKPLSTYSKGMQKKFMLTTVLAREVDLLIMDEPMEGLDAAARQEFIDILQEFMLLENKSVLLSTHLTSDLEKFVDYIAWMKKGRIALFEEKETLLDSYQKIYIPKELLTDERKHQLEQIKKEAFSYVALTKDSSIWETCDEITCVRPQLEDFIKLG